MAYFPFLNLDRTKLRNSPSSKFGSQFLYDNPAFEYLYSSPIPTCCCWNKGSTDDCFRWKGAYCFIAATTHSGFKGFGWLCSLGGWALFHQGRCQSTILFGFASPQAIPLLKWGTNQNFIAIGYKVGFGCFAAGFA